TADGAVGALDRFERRTLFSARSRRRQQPCEKEDIVAAALLNLEGFKRAIGALIDQAYQAGRGADLERIVEHADKTSPDEVSRLAALMYLVDQEYLHPLQDAIEAYRRYNEKKDIAIVDDAILEVMREVWLARKGGHES